MAGSRTFNLPSLDDQERDPFPLVDTRDVLAVRRALLPGRSRLAQLQLVYISLLTVGIVGIVLRGVWAKVGSFFMDVASPYHLVWGPPAILLLTLAVLRYSTMQGFVSFSEPDCAFLLGGPVPRKGLVWPRLRSAAIVLGIGGAVVGALAGLASRGPTMSGVRIGEETAAGFALGVLLVAASWHIQRLGRASLWVLRLTLPAVAVAVLLALAKRQGGTVNWIALWSGPWGWAVLPSAGRAGRYGLAGVALLWAVAVAGWISLPRTADRCSLENFERRARTRSRVVAALYSFDTRFVVLASRRSRTRLPRFHLRLPPPRRPFFVLSWRGSLGLIRSPLRLGWGILLSGAGALFIAVGHGHRGIAWGGALILYLAAGALLEPLRLEVDSPAASHLLLPWPYGRVLWLHCLLPTAIMALTGIVTVGAGWAVGYVSLGALVAFLVTAIPVMLMVVLGAALSARRGGRVPVHLVLMTAGDSTGLSVLGIVAWIFAWAVFVIAVLAVAAGRLAQAGSPLSGAVALALGFIVLAVILQRVLLASKA